MSEFARRCKAAGFTHVNDLIIIKILKSDPPRRITIDEFVAFAEVLEISVISLLEPPGAHLATISTTKLQTRRPQDYVLTDNEDGSQWVIEIQTNPEFGRWVRKERVEEVPASSNHRIQPVVRDQQIDRAEGR